MPASRVTSNRLRARLAAAAVAAALPVAAAAQTPSKWGAADEIGAANYLSPAKVLEAAKLIKMGKVYSLGIPVGPDTPAFPPRSCKLYVVQPGQQAGGSLGPTKTTYNDDILDCWVGIGTQLDGLGHIGIDNVYYNGNKAADFADATGLKKLGIEKVPPIATRGVLLDMAAYYGTDLVPEGTAFNVAEIEGAAKRQGVEIRQGDVVLFHTGWLNLIGKEDKRFGSVEPGLGLAGARYLVGKGVVAVGADTWGLETLPFPKDTGVFEVHQELIAKNGTYILENIDSRELARDKAYEFLFVLGQPKYVGAGLARQDLRSARVDPAQSLEAREVCVGRVEDVAALHRQDGKVRVGGEIRRGAQAFELRSEPREVPIRGLRDMEVRQGEPDLDSLHHVRHRERPGDDSAVGGDPDEPEDGRPCEPDALRSGEAAVPPSTCRGVRRRVRVMGVNEDVDVGQDHARFP